MSSEIELTSEMKRGAIQVENVRATMPEYLMYCSRNINSHMGVIKTALEAADQTNNIIDIAKFIGVALGRLKVLDAFHKSVFEPMTNEALNKYWDDLALDLKQEVDEHEKEVANAN